RFTLTIILSRWLYSSDINDIVVIVNTFFIIKSY
ncbi:transposase, partial [Salmonella enterica subsp. enterica serovar Typhimurium var. 5-]